MHRVRQSLGYYEEFGWQPTIVTVYPDYVEGQQDPLLEQTLPEGLRVIRVKAFSTKYTRKIGLGSLALRSLYFYWRTVNRLLKKERFDLVFFSTTQFPVLILGAYWKRRFGIPYVIDMQDPWHTDYYLSKPKAERPPKYWFAYRLNKWLEPIAMRRVDALMSVSEAYLTTLQERYSNITPEMCHTITFGAYEIDFEILARRSDSEGGGAFERDFEGLRARRSDSEGGEGIDLVYVGRAGHDMEGALRALFEGFRMGLEKEPELFEKVRFHFSGTSYAAGDKGKKTVEPVAERVGVAGYVHEQPARVPYFTSLQLLRDADLLVVPGSEDPQYTASKLYPYILAKKPLLAIFHEQSSVVEVLRQTRAGECVTFPSDDLAAQVYERLRALLVQLPFTPKTDWEAFRPYTARERARVQVEVFEKCLS
ncbi:MAG: glycosyltransferase [Lewinellaceae bacterium]|nr:glycosyltransferase [Lewinellaceae bacterium]